jgi:DNA-binding beta-propeller fold protein YncE
MIRQLITIFVASAVCASTIGAQQSSAPADSAAVARAAWARAMSAFQRDDLTVARGEIDRAAQAWPAQPAYIWAQAGLAERARDATATQRALTRYADLGLGRDLHDSTLSQLLGDAFPPLAARHDSNRAALTNSTSRPLLADSTFWPEGIDADPRTQRLYIASVRHRVVAEVLADGSSHELWARDRGDLAPVLGVRVDTARNSVWATTSGLRNVPGFDAADTAKASLLRFDLGSHTIVQRIDFPVIRGGHVLGDLAIGPDGSVWIPDSQQPILYRLRPNATTLEEIRSPLFYSLQGAAPTPDGKWLYVADYSLGLLRMNIATGAIALLSSPDNATVVGCDGIVWYEGSIIAVQNGVSPARIIRIVPDALHDRLLRIDVLDRNVAVADEPTIGTLLAGEFVYVANSQWTKFSDAGARNSARPLTPPIALRLPLRR